MSTKKPSTMQEIWDNRKLRRCFIHTRETANFRSFGREVGMAGTKMSHWLAGDIELRGVQLDHVKQALPSWEGYPDV